MFNSLQTTIACVAIAGTLHWPVSASAETFKIDPEHTSVGFKVRHLFTTVSGRFDKFDGDIVFDSAKPHETKVTGTIEVASVNTNLEERDKDLRSPRFFDAAKYPRITFTSDGPLTLSGDPKSLPMTGQLRGKLTIRDVERTVTLDVKYIGQGKDPWGNTKAGFSATIRINRKDFGLSWNETLETGGVLVGDDVDIDIQAEASVQP